MSNSLRPVHFSGLCCMLLASVLTLVGGASAHAQTALADTPVYSTSNVPANLMLSLSVEFPTGTVGAYNNATNYTTYSATSPFLGYFDPAKCYDYSTSSPPGSNTSGYFVPIGTVSSTGSCLSVSGGTTTYHWSGNMLNWATMTALDEFRQALTGGNRVVDTTSSTVLIRSNLNSQSNTGNFANKTIGSGTNVAASTVIGDANYASLGTVYLKSAAQGTTFVISNNSSFSSTGSTGSGGSKVNNIATTYNAEVQVCVPTLLEANCNSAHQASDYVGAGVYNKPEGLIQQNYTKIRVGAAAYAFQYGTGAANGAVRALLRDNGPTTYNGYGARQTNTYSEWDATTGIFTPNPGGTVDTTGTAPGGGNATQTGAINYLNQFGYANGYETNDTVADLYWAALAYLMHVPLDSSYTNGLTNSNSLDVAFPVFTGTKLKDPIQYTCQTNAILSIGDIHTWYDTRVPSTGGPAPSSANQAALAVVNGADAGGYATALGNLPLIEKNGTTAASVTMAQLRYKGSSATTSTVVPAANQLGLTTEPNGTTNSTYNMAGLAYFAHTQEIRPDLVALQTGATFKHTVSTYTVDVLEPGAYDGTSGKEIYNPANFNTSGGAAGPSMYWLASKYGGFNDINNDGVPANPLTWHTNSSSGTALRPDNYFPGNQPTLIQSGLQQIFNNVASTATQSGAAPTVTPTRVLTNITASTAPFYSPASGFPIFTTSYTPISWVGDVTGYVGSVNAGGSVSQVSGSVPWHAQLQLDTLTQAVAGTGWNTGRRILTMNTATKAPAPFRYLSLSPAQQAALNGDSTLLNYLRGDKSNETTKFRARIHILGDIVDSQAVLIQGATSPSYTETANPGYTAFSTSVASRQPVVYVGANDGMLHAFEGDFLNPTTANPVTGGGSELFAYVPSLLFQGPNGTPSVDGLAALANLNGVSTNNYSHHFYVDQTPQVSDVDFTLTGNGGTTPVSTTATANWHTLLVGGLGKGGKGIYALDVTTVPAAVNTTTSVADEAALIIGNNKKVLWEFTDADMGYSYGAPLIVKTRKYGWVVVATSGYNNTASGQDGHGVLYIINVQTGALIQKIDTGVGTTTSPAGLTQATGYTQDVSDGTIDQIYAGDLLGNVWRFDLSEPAVSGGVGTGPYPSPTLFATLKDPSGAVQPITTAPRVETDIDSTGLGTLRWVFVGTGQFLSTSDLTSTQQQTMYALRDGTGSTPATAGLPRSRTAAAPYNLVPNPLTAPLALTDSSTGWYYDLPGTAGSSGGTERIVVNPDSAAGVPIIAWASITPSSDPCSLLGSIYAVDFSTGQTVIYGTGSTTTLVSSINTGTATNGAQVVQLPNGTYSILYGQTGASPATANIKQPGGGNYLYRVNWREILQ